MALKLKMLRKEEIQPAADEDSEVYTVKGDAIVINEKEVIVGRSGKSVMRVHPKLNAVSREHCILKKHFGGWTISDMNSTNGTYLHIKKYDCRIKILVGEYPLNEGDQIQLGGLSEHSVLLNVIDV